MRISIVFVLLLLSTITQLRAQFGFVQVKGRVVDEEGLSLPYVNISLKEDRSIGTYSNSLGEFEIHLSTSANTDSLVFSSIGYENTVIGIGSVQSSAISIILKSKAYILNEVVITPDTATAIVKRGIDLLRKNLASENNILQGFYREVIRSNNTYDRLIEAAVDVFDKGYTTPKKEHDATKDHDLEFKIREIRKSNDYQDLDWEQSIMNYIKPRNGLYGSIESLFFNDYIRNNGAYYNLLMNAPINEDFFKHSLLTVDSMINYENEPVWCIGIQHQPSIASGQLLPYGTIYIRSRDYAIIQMTFETRVNPRAISDFSVPDERFLHKTIIKYREYHGKMYLSLLYRKSFRFSVNSAKSRKARAAGKRDGHLFYELLFVTNEIITEKDKVSAFKRKERITKNIDLYSATWNYNEAFWKNYNAVNERPLAPNAKKDIERESALDEQFKKNGSNP
ncbi:MAG TPA: carboxypeptidase-like regulatory domain-containing protein [Ohtaekwangia sp.]|uniref:carboxypeptidase-like regulatory domain-containing protein n=1 Tax=Ohtaekwangia sp. TaxID=2066019 RepID=UPI002F93A528